MMRSRRLFYQERQKEAYIFKSQLYILCPPDDYYINLGMQLANQQIIELVTMTYTSNSTEQIQKAYNILINNAYEIYPRSFKQLEDILACKGSQIDANCKKAIANLIKITGVRMLETIGMYHKTDDDWTNKHRKLLHVVQHILDNREIQNTMKNPVVELYIQLFNHFSPENHSRLICKAKYYFNTKEYLLPICLIETYLAQEISYKYRFAFSELNIELLVFESDRIIQTIINTMRPLDYSVLPILHKLFRLLATTWKQMTFQKYQKAYNKLFMDKVMINLVSNLRKGPFGLFQKTYFHEIYSYIIESLGRCKLYHKYSQLMGIINSIVMDEFQDFLNVGEKEVSTLTMLSSAIQYKFIDIQLSSYEIFTKIIYPNYLCFSKYLKSQADNLPQVINFLDDATFYMQSEMVEVLRHKVLYYLCRNWEDIWISYKGLFYSYFYQHNCNFGNGEGKVTLSNCKFQKGLDTWVKINQNMSQDQQLQIILLYTALSAKFFISEIPFMTEIESFVFENQDHLLKNQNKKIVFYTLLLYKNYMDDIFNATTSVGFREKIISFAISNQSEHIFKEFSIDIIRQKLSQGPTYEQFSREINLIVKDMTTQYKQYQIPIISLIFKAYGEHIDGQDAITIIKETLSIWKGKEIYKDQKSPHLQLLKMFLNIRSCSEFYMHLIEEMLQIANQNVNLVQRHMQEVLEILVKGLETCKRLPENFQVILIKYQLVVNNISMMESVNQLIMYSTSANFFNWLAVMLTKNNLTTYEILLIHNLIYFGNKKLTYQSIKTIIEVAYLERVYKLYEFDYRNGKINLIFLFLLKYNWKETNELLLNENWSQAKAKVQEYTKKMILLGKQEQFGRKPLIEQIYDFLYKMQNVYRWKYDIQMFLINQLDLFKYQINDHYQFMYANLSFLACTFNLLRAHEFLDMFLLEEYNEEEDSFKIQSKIQAMYHEAEEILSHFAVPQHLKEADYFSVYRKTLAQLKKDQGGRQWVETLFNAAFRKQQHNRLEIVLKIQKSPQGNYRKIQKIRMRNDQKNGV